MDEKSATPPTLVNAGTLLLDQKRREAKMKQKPELPTTRKSRDMRAIKKKAKQYGAK
jgi:hypothetical protein